MRVHFFREGESFGYTVGTAPTVLGIANPKSPHRAGICDLPTTPGRAPPKSPCFAKMLDVQSPPRYRIPWARAGRRTRNRNRLLQVAPQLPARIADLSYAEWVVRWFTMKEARCDLCGDHLPLIEGSIWPSFAYKRFVSDFPHGESFFDLRANRSSDHGHKDSMAQ